MRKCTQYNIYFSCLTDRPQEAEDCYRRALSIKGDHINANTNIAHLCRIQGRWEEAVTYYSTALRRRPKNPLLHYYLGFVYEQLSSAENRQVG
jgi:tetratricopeptide (TPR) repeat protein